MEETTASIMINRFSQIFQNSRCHLKILYARSVKYRIFHTEDHKYKRPPYKTLLPQRPGSWDLGTLSVHYAVLLSLLLLACPKSKYSPQHMLLKSLSLCSSPHIKHKDVLPDRTTEKIMVFLYFNIHNFTQ